MTYNPDIHHRRSIRLKGFDYSSANAYFVTLRTREGECLFGHIVADDMLLNDAGWLVAGVWHELPGRFPHVSLDEFVVMPNHVHGIIMIQKDAETTPVRAIHELPLQQHKPGPCNNGGIWHDRRKMFLPTVIGYLKMNSAKKINQIRNSPGVPVWHRNYYERIIRNEHELTAIREYIRHNPMKWEHDEENPVS